MVSIIYCMETLSPPSIANAPCLVLLMLLDGSQHDCEWGLVLSCPTMGAKCYRRWILLSPNGFRSLLG